MIGTDPVDDAVRANDLGPASTPEASLEPPSPDVVIAKANPGFGFIASQNTTFNPQAISITGSSFPHNNMMPFLAVTFIIALQGIFPPRG